MGVARPADDAAQVALAAHGTHLSRARAAVVFLTGIDGLLAACHRQHSPCCPALTRRPVLFPEPAHMGPLLARRATAVIRADGERPASPAAVARPAQADVAGRAFLPAILHIFGSSRRQWERTELRHPCYTACARRLCRIGFPAQFSC